MAGTFLSMDVSDGELGRRIAASVPGAASDVEAELYGRAAPRVRLYGLRPLRDVQAAADLTQQVLLMTMCFQFLTSASKLLQARGREGR